jgi:hypothetical protein
MTSRKVAIILNFLITISLGKEVGDFAPIGVGKSWRYWHNYSKLEGVGLTGEVRNSVFIVNVGEKSIRGDTLEYKLNMIDSIYNWYRYGGRNRVYFPSTNISYATTIWEYPNGTIETASNTGIDTSISNKFIKSIFSMHTYDEGAVVLDTSNPNIETVKIDNNQDSTHISYFKNIGLHNYAKIDRFDMREDTYDLWRYSSHDTALYSSGIVIGRTSIWNPTHGAHSSIQVDVLGRKIPTNNNSSKFGFIYESNKSR